MKLLRVTNQQNLDKYEKPVRHISVNKELKKLLLFTFIGFFIFVGSIYFLFRETKRPGVITIEQYIQTNKKERESIQEVSQKTQNVINYITDTKREYDWIGGANIKFRNNQIDPYPNYDQFNNIKTKK